MVLLCQKECVNDGRRKKGTGERREQNKLVKGVMGVCTCCVSMGTH